MSSKRVEQQQQQGWKKAPGKAFIKWGTKIPMRRHPKKEYSDCDYSYDDEESYSSSNSNSSSEDEGKATGEKIEVDSKEYREFCQWRHFKEARRRVPFFVGKHGMTQHTPPHSYSHSIPLTHPQQKTQPPHNEEIPLPHHYHHQQHEQKEEQEHSEYQRNRGIHHNKHMFTRDQCNVRDLPQSHSCGVCSWGKPLTQHQQPFIGEGSCSRYSFERTPCVPCASYAPCAPCGRMCFMQQPQFFGSGQWSRCSSCIQRLPQPPAQSCQQCAQRFW